MPSPNQRTGRAWITIDGILYETMTGATIENIIGLIRDEVSGADVFGFAEEAKAPTITCKFAHSAGVSITKIASVTDGTIVFACDSGPVIGLNNAWSCTDKLTASKDGGIDCTFKGKSTTELIP